MARVVEGVGTQVRQLVDSSGRQDDRVSGFGRATQSVQSLVLSTAQQAIAASTIGDRVESNSLVGKNMAPEWSTNKVSFKQWSRRYKLVAGTKDKRFKTRWAEARQSTPLHSKRQQHNEPRGETSSHGD